jgi:ribulose-phosphate 3-epimerase
MRAGIALKPGTPIDDIIASGAADAADMILIMTVEPGFGGQSFMGDMMTKVASLRSKYPYKLIQVDGGVDTKTISTVAEAGANVIVSGSGVFKAPSHKDAMDTMRNTVRTALKAKGLNVQE